jgi:cell division protein FtsQ
MESNSHRKSGSSARSTGRKRVVIGAGDTSKVKYKSKARPKVEPLRRHAGVRSSDPEHTRTGDAGKRVSKAKRDQRERRQREIGQRRLLIAAGIALAVCAAVAGLVALARAPIFPVTAIRVTGNHRLTGTQVAAAAHVPVGTTLLRVQAGAIEQSLKTQPWIGEAKVIRHFPGTLELHITERTPVAIVDAGGTHVWLVDGSGVWIANASTEPSSALPTIRDVEGLAPRAGVASPSPELRNALQVWQGISPELRAKVRGISAPTIDKTALILAHGVQVFIGSSEEVSQKDARARLILSKYKNVVYINVRVLNSVIVRSLKTTN